MAQIYDFKEIIYLFQLHFKIVSDVCLLWFLGIRGCVKSPLSPRLTRGRKRTDFINQLFIRSVLMRSRVKRGNRAVLYCPHTPTNNGLYILEMHSRASLRLNTPLNHHLLFQICQFMNHFVSADYR